MSRILNKNLTLKVLPQIDFWGDTKPTDPEPDPLSEFELLEEKTAIFTQAINQFFSVETAIFKNNFLKNSDSLNYQINKIIIDGSEYLPNQEVTYYGNFSLYFDDNFNNSFILKRYTNNILNVPINLEVQQLTGDYQNETLIIPITLDLKYILAPVEATITEENQANLIFLSNGNLENYFFNSYLDYQDKFNRSRITTTKNNFSYQWRKIGSEGIKIYCDKSTEANGTIEGRINLEDPQAEIELKISDNLKITFSKNPDLRFDSYTELLPHPDFTGEHLKYTVTTPKTYANWDLGKIKIIENNQTEIIERSLNNTDTFKINWSGSNLNFYLDNELIKSFTVSNFVSPNLGQGINKPYIKLSALKSKKWYSSNNGYRIRLNPNSNWYLLEEDQTFVFWQWDYVTGYELTNNGLYTVSPDSTDTTTETYLLIDKTKILNFNY